MSNDTLPLHRQFVEMVAEDLDSRVRRAIEDDLRMLRRTIGSGIWLKALTREEFLELEGMLAATKKEMAGEIFRMTLVVSGQRRRTRAAALVERRRRRSRRAGQRGGLDLLTWTTLQRRLLGPERPFDLVEHRYLAGIYGDTCQEMVVCKAGQVGVSEFLISWVLWSADVRKATGLYVFPTDTHVSDFSAARLGPAIEAEVSPYLAKLVVAAKGSKRGADRVGLKRVRDRFVYFRGAKVQPDGRAAQLRSIDADRSEEHTSELQSR